MRKYGWKPQRPDHRDYLYKVIAPEVSLPSVVDLRATCSAVENQGDLGSCTANALVGNLEFLEKKNFQPFQDMSRLFIYYNERLLEHTIHEDSGAALRDGIKSLSKAGCCPEVDWPYDISKFTNRPSLKCYIEALHYKIKSYFAIQTQQEMLTCLADGYPFVFGISVYESFESQDVAKTGIVPMPSLDERNLGGHAVCAVGYDMNKQVFIVRNSWGAEWGDKGYFYLPFEYMDKLSSDHWTIRR
jgi:C1A family cysteine protease